MAFVVEDGTGLSNSNAYVSTAEADAYFSDRGNTTWAAAVTADKQAAILKASQYIDAKFLDRFRGPRVLKYTQAMQWPRTMAIDRNGFPLLGLPQAIKNGTMEAAVIFLTTDVTQPLEHGGGVKEEQVGPIKTVYKDGSSDEVVYPAIELALKVCLKAGISGLSMTR